MTQVIPSDVPRKKAAILKKREEQLLRKIRSSSISVLLCKAAGQVREAKLAYLKAKRHHATDPSKRDNSDGRKIYLQIEEWRTKTEEEIVEKYRLLDRKGK